PRVSADHELLPGLDGRRAGSRAPRDQRFRGRDFPLQVLTLARALARGPGTGHDAAELSDDEQNDGPRHAVVGQDQHNATLAAVVRALMNELSWNKSRELVRTGRVTVDGAMVFDPAIRLAKGA